MTRSPRPTKPSSPKKKGPVTPARPAEVSAPDRPAPAIILSPEAIGMLEELARERGMSTSAVVEALIERARSAPSSNNPTPPEPAPAAAPAAAVDDPAPAGKGSKKGWDEAIREFREMRARQGK